MLNWFFFSCQITISIKIVLLVYPDVKNNFLLLKIKIVFQTQKPFDIFKKKLKMRCWIYYYLRTYFNYFHLFFNCFKKIYINMKIMKNKIIYIKTIYKKYLKIQKNKLKIFKVLKKTLKMCLMVILKNIYNFFNT